MNDYIKIVYVFFRQLRKVKQHRKQLKKNFSRSTKSYHWIRRASSLQNSHDKIPSRESNSVTPTSESEVRNSICFIPVNKTDFKSLGSKLHTCLTKWCLAVDPSTVANWWTTNVHSFCVSKKYKANVVAWYLLKLISCKTYLI